MVSVDRGGDTCGGKCFVGNASRHFLSSENREILLVSCWRGVLYKTSISFSAFPAGLKLYSWAWILGVLYHFCPLSLSVYFCLYPICPCLLVPHIICLDSDLSSWRRAGLCGSITLLVIRGPSSPPPHDFPDPPLGAAADLTRALLTSLLDVIREWFGDWPPHGSPMTHLALCHAFATWPFPIL